MKLYRLIFLTPLLAALFAACAKGDAVVDPGQGGSGGEGGMGPLTGIGAPCPDGMCEKGTCTQVGNAKYCTQPCPPGCPLGTYCSFINNKPLCIPDVGNECARCIGSVDCKMPTDQCLTAPLGDKFCARDCSALGDCPNGFECVEGTKYPASEVDAGADDGGATDGGGGSGGGGTHGNVYKFCVPISGFSCPCDKKRDGVKHDCHNTNNYGDCVGQETCDGTKGMFEGCTATTPIAEECNGKDDNCNMQIDEGDPNLLCESMGPKPPHGNWACANAQCKLGACDPGWHPYPPGSPAQGCPCQDEATEPNGTCNLAPNLGAIDDGGGSLVIKGTLSADNDVDVWQFDANDVDEGTTNSYHVALSFQAPMPNNEFMMDVERSATCSDTPSGPGVGITDYDWCVAGTGMVGGVAVGEAPCGPTSSVHCANHSSHYFVRVYRKGGSKGTCSEYQIVVRANSGTGCDFTQTCP